MRRHALATGAAGLALVLLGAAVQLSVPDEEALRAPFVQRAAVDRAGDQPTVGRDVAAGVTGVRLARSVSCGTWSGVTTGVWLVVDARVGTVLTTGRPDAVLLLGGVRYDASDRPDSAAMTGITLQAGLPYAGAFLFELPRAAISGRGARHATVRIFAHRDPALDSAIDVPLDLTGRRIEASFQFDAPARVAP